jgi:methyl-accepting chemotaxis protein
MQEYLNSAEHEAVQDCESLQSVLSLLEQVSEPHDGFKKINKVLRMLGISTKIESARLGNSAAGFDTLAADVANLSVQVLDKSQIILSQQSELGNTIRVTLAGVHKMEAEQRVQVHGILQKTRASLDLLKEINSHCTGMASIVASASSEISRSISEVVTSMQTHDMVRQQIEHVETALAELLERLHSGASDGVELAVEASDICELQAAQLRLAGSEISSAVRIIIDNLSAIATKESNTASQTREMAGVADKAGSSFFSELEHGLERVVASLAGNADANRSITRAMTTVAGTVGEIVAYVGDIEQIGEEIELIAMNAQVKAARTGDDGAALGVLAEAIQRLSVEAQEQTGTVSNTLRSVTTSTDQLFHGVNEEAEILEHDVDVMVGELQSLLLTLRNLNESLISKVMYLEQQVTSLSGDIESTTSSITVHERMTDGLAEVISGLDLLLKETAVFVPDNLAKGKTERLKELAKRYTMHSERKVHEGFAGGGETLGGGGSNDMDDNIELF